MEASEVGAPPGALGDDGGFAAWYADAWPRLVRAVVLFTGDGDDAPDIAAEACARVLVRWDGPTRPEDPTRWAVAVALNLAKKQWRRAQQDRPERLWDGKRSAGLGEADVDLWRSVQSLPPRAREAVALRYGCDLTEQGVADAMGISAGTAAATLHSARQKLRQILGEGGSHG